MLFLEESRKQSIWIKAVAKDDNYCEKHDDNQRPVLGAWHAFLYAQSWGSRTLSAIQCLGLDLRQPSHRSGTVASDAAAAAGIVLLTKLALARRADVAASHGLSWL